MRISLHDQLKIFRKAVPVGVGTIESITLLVGAMVSLIVVLLLAWFALRWIGRRTPMGGSMSGKHIQILDRVMLAQDKCLLLVRVAEKTMLIGMSGAAVENLGEIADPEKMLDQEPLQQKSGFSSLLGEYMSRGGFRSKKEDAD